MRRVVVLDDDHDLRDLVVTILELEGFECVPCANAAEALAAQAEEGIHAIVSDQMLPDMTGTELCSVLRKEGAETPMVFMSGDREIELMARGLRRSAVIHKPFQIQDLVDTLRSLVA